MMTMIVELSAGGNTHYKLLHFTSLGSYIERTVLFNCRILGACLQ